MDFLAWIIFGALVGWLASIIMKTDAQQGMIANVIIGIVGSLIGGFIARSLGGSGVTGFNLGSLLVAIGGSILLIMIVRLFSHQKSY